MRLASKLNPNLLGGAVAGDVRIHAIFIFILQQ